MCRLLAVRAGEPFPVAPWLERFAAMARASREYQGDGWGCAWREGGAWHTYHSVTPVWLDGLRGFGQTSVLVAHARSAFAGSEVRVEHNMPFLAGPLAFAFNGELRGVRLREEGRIGAETLFNTIRRLTNGDLATGLARAARVVRSRTAYVRAMNVVLCDGERIAAHSEFSEEPEYFTLHVARRGELAAVCSEPLPGDDWSPLPNGALEVIG